MKTIGFLTTSYPRYEGDPAGVFVRAMAKSLVARNYRIEVLVPEADQPSALDDDRITVRPVRYAPPSMRRTFYGGGVPDNVRRDLRAWPGLATYPAALAVHARQAVAGWDAIVSHWAVPCGLIGGVVRGGRPHLAVLHSADAHVVRSAPGPLRRRLAAKIAAGASELLFSSAALRTEFLSFIDVIPRARVAGRAHASAMGIEPIPEPSGAKKRERMTVVTMGRLVAIKGIEHAIEAVAGDPNLDLIVAGDGPLRKRLEEQARRLHANVSFVGTVSGLDKAELLHSAHAFLIPSVDLASGRTEGSPTAVLEAASAGLPIVASHVGGLPELFEQDISALFVPAGDTRAIRTALRRLRDDVPLRTRIGAAAREEADRYRWSELAPRIDALLGLDAA